MLNGRRHIKSSEVPPRYFVSCGNTGTGESQCSQSVLKVGSVTDAPACSAGCS